MPSTENGVNDALDAIHVLSGADHTKDWPVCRMRIGREWIGT